jgi:hypothetical protein
VAQRSKNFIGRVCVSSEPIRPFRPKVKIHPHFRKMFDRRPRFDFAHSERFVRTVGIPKGAAAGFERRSAAFLRGEAEFDGGEVIPCPGGLRI